MNHDETDLLVDAVEQICAGDEDPLDTVGEGGFDGESWRRLEQSGFTLVSVPSEFGGGGGSLQDAAAVTRAAGRLGLAIPLSETMWLAGWMLAESGGPVPKGPMTAVSPKNTNALLTRTSRGWRLDGVLRRVPWAAYAKHLVGLISNGTEVRVVRFDPCAAKFEDGANIAGEPRQDVTCRGVYLAEDDVLEAGPNVTSVAFASRGAVSRVAALSGAAEQVLRLAVTQAKQREQFGRPLAKFQAIQQLLAQLAAETASVVVAAQAAALSLDREEPEQAAFSAAAAKASASASAGAIAALGHQVIGALGFTMEHPLQRSTRRLWAWREEYGNERIHQLDLAKRVLSGDAWDLISGSSTADPEEDASR